MFNVIANGGGIECGGRRSLQRLLISGYVSQANREVDEDVSRQVLLTCGRDPTYRSLEKVDDASLDMLAFELGKETPGVEVHVMGQYRCTSSHSVL